MTLTGCYFCTREGAQSHEPIPDKLCASCGEPYMLGCKETHHHDSWSDCWSYADIRTLHCGCYAHKECQKSGNVCREHGEVLSTGWVDGAFQPGHATLSCSSCDQAVTALVQVNGVAPGVCAQCFKRKHPTNTLTSPLERE